MITLLPSVQPSPQWPNFPLLALFSIPCSFLLCSTRTFVFTHKKHTAKTFKDFDLPLVPEKEGQVQSGITLWGKTVLLQYQHSVPGLECTSKLLVYSWVYFTEELVCTKKRRRKKKKPLGHKERNAVKAARPWQLDEPSRPTLSNHKHG